MGWEGTALLWLLGLGGWEVLVSGTAESNRGRGRSVCVAPPGLGRDVRQSRPNPFLFSSKSSVIRVIDECDEALAIGLSRTGETARPQDARRLNIAAAFSFHCHRVTEAPIRPP